MSCAATAWLLLPLLLLCVTGSTSLFLPDSEELRQLLSRYEGEADPVDRGNRTRRAIRWSDREEILQLHNKLRGGVYPTASDMEFMVWDDELEQSATQWAETCHWDHGPQDLLMSIGQNLAVHSGRYRSPAFHVQAWYDEVKDYTYPYPHECNPWCPERCSGPMCTHYTQLVWATTNRVGCAVHVCPKMNVWGDTWDNAVYLVCNYSPKGNWIGEAPYRHGHPCSHCPPSYGGGCRNNLCYKETAETQDMNEVEKPQVPPQPRTTAAPTPKPKPKPSAPKKPASDPIASRTPSSNPSSSAYFAQNIKCETRLRDKCRGITCNRYKCPANCTKKKGKVWGTLFYDVQSSICRAAIHSGAIDNNGGLVHVTRMDKQPFFVRSTTNGIDSFSNDGFPVLDFDNDDVFYSKHRTSNAFLLAKVEETTADCYTTVAEVCPYQKPSSLCPRFFCPPDCKAQPPHWSPVIGNNIYADGSSICKAAIHAGVLGVDGGYVDILPLDKRKNYVGVLKNGIQSESKNNIEGGSFKVFAVRQ